MEHSEEYLAGQDAHYRGLSDDITKYDSCLFAMIDALIEHDYMREFDWKEDLRVIAKKLGVSFDIEIDLGFLDDGEDAECLEPEQVFTLVAVYISNFCYDMFVSMSIVTVLLWACCRIKIISAMKLCWATLI